MQPKVWLMAWFFIAIKFLFPAILVYFLGVMPIAGSGYGAIFCGIYLCVVCPLIVNWVRRKVAQNKTQS